MEEGLKRRLVGATVLVSLVVIFVPMLLEGEPVVETGIYKTNVPNQPDSDFSSRVLPLADTEVEAPPPEVVPLLQDESDSGPVMRAETESNPAAAVKPSAPRVGLSAWVIQVGSFSRRENAESLLEDLRKKKFPAFLEQAEVRGSTVFRVRVGPEIDEQLAQKMLADLDKVLEPLKLKGSLKRYR